MKRHLHITALVLGGFAAVMGQFLAITRWTR